MKPIRWGIVSTALIGTQKVIPAMRKSASIEVAAIASRTLAAAQEAATRLDIPKAHGSYEALLADPDIDAIYNPLPNHLHVPLTLAAARAGKHVLCEKPMAMNAAELEALRPFASQVHIREGFMVRSHPQWSAARQLVRDGAIGTLQFMQVPFCYFNDDPGNIRNRADIGGGALYDIGGYVIVAGRWFFERDPERVVAAIHRDPALHTDTTTSGVLDFGAGHHLSFTISTQSTRYQRAQLIGTTGRIEIEIPFNPPQDGASAYSVSDPNASDGSGMRRVVLPPADQYQLQLEAFSQAVREQAPDASGLDDAVMNMRIIDALFRSGASGQFERP